MIRNAALDSGITRASFRGVSPSALTVLAIASALLVGYAVAAEYALYLIAAAALAVTILAPQTALLAWVAGLLASGRDLTHLQISNGLYVTEIVLAGFVVGVALQALRTPAVGSGWRIAGWLNAALWAPALGGVLLKTATGGHEWLPNFALVYYALFALIGAAQVPTTRLFRQLFALVLCASSVAFVLVMSGSTSEQGISTSTAGLTKLAHSSFAFPFGIAPLIIFVAVRQQLLKVYWLAAAVPFLAALVLLNHRSAWLAFAAALLAVLSVRITFPVVATLAAVLLMATAVVQHETQRHPTARLEVGRARSVTNQSDPNARYRLEFWRALLHESLRSPLIGSGFDPYPERLLPRATGVAVRSDPHNSFVALAYRVGLLGASIVLAVCLITVARGVALAIKEADDFRRCALTTLVGVVVYVGFLSAFNVFLELPYGAPVFWVPLGLLMSLVWGTSRRPLMNAAN